MCRSSTHTSLCYSRWRWGITKALVNLQSMSVLFRRVVIRSPPPRRLFTLSQPSKPSRIQRYARRSFYITLALGTVYTVDRTFNASAISRNFRTLWICALISTDYKLNFTPEHADRIPQIHQRVADRMYDLFTKNGGLYIKIGESCYSRWSCLRHIERLLIFQAKL